MLTSLVFGAALAAPAAPVPRDTDPAPAGPPPWVVHLKADAGGQVVLVTYATQTVKVTHTVVTVENGKQVMKQVQQDVTQKTAAHHLFNDLHATVAAADGTPVTTAEVVKRAKDGVVVLVSADGKPVEKAWLRALDPDALVVTAAALAGSTGPPAQTVRTVAPAPRLARLGTDAAGKVQVAYNLNVVNGGNGLGGDFAFVQQRGMFVNNGLQVQQILPLVDGPLPAGPADAAGAAPTKPLADVAFDAYDSTGKRVPRGDALERLKAGGLVLIAGDNRVPDAAYLEPFRGDLLVLVSPELLNVPTRAKAGVRRDVVPPAPVQLAPAVQPVAVPARVVPGAVLRARPVRILPAPARPAVEEATPLPARKPLDEK